MNALSDNISPAMALLAEIHRLFSANHIFYSNREKQHKSYLLFDNKLSFNQHIDDMSKKATNLLNSYHLKTVYNMTVRPPLGYAPIYRNPYTICNIDKNETVQCNDVKFYMTTVQLPMTVEKTRNLENNNGYFSREYIAISLKNINNLTVNN